jgi:parallel beta-helix repeat protein
LSLTPLDQMLMIRSLFLLTMGVTLLLPITGYSATYYLSSLSGNDNNDGLSLSTPWQSIAKLNETVFADNAIILFKRGEIFRGAISTKKFPKGLTFGAYGDGDNPIISGSVQITGWVPTSHPSLMRQVYEADVTALPLTEAGIEHLFLNNELMTIARYPNVDSPAEKNWLKVGGSAGKGAFTDPQLKAYAKPNNYWKGATLRIRNYSWTYTVKAVTGYQAGSGKITAKGLGNQLPEWGYFLDNKLTELDHPGEWYYDAAAHKVYFYPPVATDPNTLLIEGSTYKVGISIGNQENNTVIENLSFRHFTQKGAHIGGSDNVIVRNCAFEHNLIGLTTWNTADVLISNNTFMRHLKTGIGLQASTKFEVKNSVIENNHISHTALYPLYGERSDGVYGGIGISVFGKAYTVRQNTVENTGWTGIYLKDKGHHLIENNVVRKSLLLLNDGGAIGIGSDGNTIRGNFLLETVGNVDESNGCGSTNKTPCMHHPSYGMGVGADNNFKNNVIEGNTVANNQHQGIRLNAFINTTVRNNTLYNNHKNQIVIEDKKGKSRNNVISGNIIYALGPDQMGVKLTGKTNHGSFEENYYCNPYSEVVFIRDNKRYALPHWQKAFPKYDKTSKSCGHHFTEYTVTQVGDSLLNNATFDLDVSDWKGSGASTISHDSAAMEGGALKSVYKGSKNANVIPNSFELAANQVYRLQFSVMSNGFGNLQMRINHAEPKTAWQILKERFFAYDTGRKDYETFFTAPITTAFGKILFITQKFDDKTYWLDNVSFSPVEATLNDPTQQAVLFMNPSAEAKTIALKNVSYLDLNGKRVTGKIKLAPFTSQILVASESKPVSEKPVSKKPQAPKLSVTQNGLKVTLSWNKVSDAKSYRLYYAPYPDASEVGSMDMGTETQLSLELFSGMAFYVAVSALNVAGESDYSNIEYFIIP